VGALASLRRLRWAAAFAAVVLLGVLGGRALQGEPPYRLNVPLDTAAGLYPGSDVEVAGARAGTVESIRLQGSEALVTITVDAEHAPVHRDASVQLRPKSLLGEKYLDLDPGQQPGVLASGATLPPSQTGRSVELQEIVNSLDAPTREKLQTLVVELGAGVAGRGDETNQGIVEGRQDLDDLAATADTLARRDAELQQVIDSLDQVTTELARSDRRQEMGDFIRNSDALLKDLADQDAQLKRALAETNSALARSGNGLDGTGGNLAEIARTAPGVVSQADALTTDLGGGLDTLMPHLDEFLTGVREGPIVFGGKDANGYATRITVVFGPGTAGAPTSPAGAPAGPSAPGSSASQAGAGGADGALPAPLQFLLGGGFQP
jgi:phospholipid/cholesterol/gamma-HCH transport system substrate-binding protein